MDVRGLKDMRIGLGVTRLSLNEKTKKLDGIAYYTQNLIESLSKLKAKPYLYTFGNKGVSCVFRIKTHRLKPFLLNILENYFFCKQKRVFKKTIDLFHSTDHLVPIYLDVPVIATVMDTFPISHPHLTKSFLFSRLLKNWLWKKTTEKADHIITISNFSKKEIIRNMKIPSSKISVVPLGVDDFYFKRLSRPAIQKVLKKYQLPQDYFLFIGAIQPRKNIEFMMQAHTKFLQGSQASCPLILVGNDVFNNKYLIECIKKKQLLGEVIWLKNQHNKDKRALLQNAKALLLPSIYEGFGLTILEGFASKTPVITSNIDSIKEVAGEAAMLIDPYFQESLVSAMIRIVKDDSLKKSLIQKGYQRAKVMTWGITAKKTLAVYKKILKK